MAVSGAVDDARGGLNPGHAGPVRVLHVIARLNLGGPAHVVSLVAGGLGSEFESVLVAGSLGPGEESAEDLAEKQGVAIVRVAALRPELRPLSDLRALVRMIRLVRRFRPDIVHTHTAKAGFAGRIGARLALGRRPLVVHTYHGHVLEGYFGGVRSRAFRFLEKVAARLSDELIAVSDATKDDLVRMGIASPERITVLRVGVDLSDFLALERRGRSPLRQEAGCDPGDVLATLVGRLVPVKRVDLAIRAVALARRRGAPVRLAVVGDGELRHELESLARALQVESHVFFAGYRTDMVQVAAAADLALLTSENEGTPVWLIEAAAAGLPAAATEVGGVREVVCDGCGLTVGPGDAEALAEALSRLCADPQLRSEMGRAGRAHVAKRFGAERLVSDTAALYRRLLEAQRPSADA